MGNSLKCCLSCLIPFGSLDVIRIVHLNGNVDEITHPITAGEVLSNYPNYVLTKPTSQGVVRRILILSSNSELKRGCIYFLIPASSVPENKRTSKVKKVAVDAGCVSGGVAEKKVVRRRRGRRSVDGGDWRPCLEIICEEY
ncbi:hypothetical protein QVD17_17463 [Tagetes erecta]|uniref:Uncharacterized protein n=1 Tax=Tagetes erecta TaxID=13708 RepID=A0AAD8KSA8_TARER|nr:hypothetical protein QVD17_17463 [Tagetes erecta]